MRGKAQKRKNNSDCISCQSKSARNDESKVNGAHNVSSSTHTDEADAVFRSIKDGIMPDGKGRISRSTQVDISVDLPGSTRSSYHEESAITLIVTENGTVKEKETVTIEQDSEIRFHYDIFENPPIPMTVVFALQQGLLSLSRSLSTSLLVADILCARADEALKAKLLSTTMFMSGLCTFLQNTIGIRLPLYQGPTATYVVPLLAMSTLPQWSCPDGDIMYNGQNSSSNASYTGSLGSTTDKIRMLEGSLMIAGGLHFLVGLTGLVGLLLRFIGPVTVVPALTIMGLYVYKATVKFARAQWGITFMTVGIAILLSFYLGKRQTPIPSWSRRRGCHVKFFPLHKVFSVLIATVIGWLVSAILTMSGVFSTDPKATDFYARTDSRLFIVKDTDWFIFPYPGQFGSPAVDTGALVTFLMGTISSIIDSIGDYYACAKICDAPPPPKHAVNRGIAVEGFMSIVAGWAGAGHATSTFGGNIGAIGITKVASLRVFQVLGLIFIFFGIVGKVGAIFVTIPYSVVGGMQIINFGVLIGVMLSNLQFIDLQSKRNLAIIGISMLVSMMMPYWIQSTPKAINTGNEGVDNTISMFMANPVFMAGLLACILDNTMPGTLEERGILAWQAELGVKDDSSAETIPVKDEIRLKKLQQTIYIIPYINKILRKIPGLRFVPVCPPFDAYNH